MANQPPVSGDQGQDSWAFQVTEELNSIPQPRRLPILPGNPRFGEEVWISAGYLVPSETNPQDRLRIDNDDAVSVQIGWYKYVDTRYGWSSL